MKKIISLLIVLAMLLGMVPAVFATETTVVTDLEHLVDGDYVIWAPAYGKALSSNASGYYNAGVDVEMTGGAMTGFAQTEIWTVTNNDDGTICIAQNGQLLGMGESYNSMAMNGVNNTWYVTDLGGGLCNIQNVGRGNYMEWASYYNNWSTYTPEDPTADDQFQLQFVAVENYEPEYEFPAADSELTIPKAIEVATEAGSAYTEDKYLVTGVITEIVNTTYGNMYITDEAGNTLYIYGLYTNLGLLRYDVMDPQPQVGDTITIYTVLGTYKDAPQAKNAWIYDYIPAESNGGTIEAVKGETYETETWTAPADGVLTITVSSEEGAGYKVWRNDECLHLGYSLTHDETVSYDVVAGDTFYLEVIGRSPEAWTNCDATIHYSFDFVAGGAAKEAYIISEQVITEDGTHTVTMEPKAEVTVVTISPVEAGYYTISVPEGALIANCGGGSWFITPWDSVEPSTSLDWVCAEAGYWADVEVDTGNVGADGNPIYETVNMFIEGQTIMLGIVSDSETVEVTVTKTGDYTSEEVELQEYVNKATLSQFAIPEGAVIGDYVDVYGDTHTAVLGDDGYYHLDSADGPVLLVDLDYLFRLSEALEGGRGVMYAYVTDENGKVIEKWDIGAAVKLYEAASDENKYYPLTEDLIFFYDVYAEGNGVYSFALSEGYNAECAWMYACLTMTLPGSETPEDPENPEAEPGTEENPIIIDSLPHDFYANFVKDAQAEAGVYYLYVAEKDGTIEFANVYEDFNTGTLSVIVGDNWTMLNEGGYEVKAGETLLLCHWAIWAGEYDFTLQYKEDAEPPVDPEDPEDPEEPEEPEEPEIPDSGDWSGENVEVAADETIVVTYTPDTDGVLTIAISCLTGWQIRITDEFNEETVWSDTHTSADDPVSFNLVAGTTYTITLIPYDQADGWNTCDAVMTYNITFEESGSGNPDVPVDGILGDGDNHMELPADDEDGLVRYEYIATQTGTLYFVVTYVGLDDGGTGIYVDDTKYIKDDFNGLTELSVNGVALEGYYYGSIDVVEGQSYIFVWEDVITWNAVYGWEATLNVSYSDELIPVFGTPDMPVELYSYYAELPMDSIAIAPGTTAYYVLYGFSGMTFTITGEHAYAIVTTSQWDYDTGEEIITEIRYDAVNGVVEVPITGWGASTIQIGNAGDTKTSFQLNAHYPVGSMENPDTNLNIGNNKVDIPEGSVYYYQWTAACNGTLTVTFSGKNWDYAVHNITAGIYNEWSNYYNDPQVPSVSIPVSMGDVIEIQIATLKIDQNEQVTFPAATLHFTAEVAYDHETGEGVHHDATCGKDAYTEYTCSVCGESYVEVEEGTALEHNYVDGQCEHCGAYDYILGDANGNGEVDIFDANIVAAYFNEIAELTEDQLAAADVNGDGEVNIFDANLIAAFYNEVIDEFPQVG